MKQSLHILIFLGYTHSLVHGRELPIPISPDLAEPQCSMTVDQCHAFPANPALRMCFGTKLPYSHTYLNLATDSPTFKSVQEKLTLWSGLKNVPKCWEVVQPLLCSVYLPKCTVQNDSSVIELAGEDLCLRTREPCKIVQNLEGWPSFLQCNSTHFPSDCKSEAYGSDKLRFNTTGSCERPLVPTSNKASWYGDVEGCGVQCQNPLFTDEEHRKMRIVIGVFGALCFVCTLFTVLTFIIDWKNNARYPAVLLFFINFCFCVGSLGWLAQFLPGAREDIVCKADGTMKLSQPQVGSGESYSCVVVFFVVYYFMIAGITWFVILTYAWHLTFGALGSARDVIKGKRAHFHLAAWSLPLVLTVTCLALTEIDGDSMSGICFVGYQHHAYRGWFVLAPVGLVLVVGMFFMFRGLIALIRIKITSPGLISDKASAKIRDTIIRLGIFAGFAIAFVVITFIVHLYIFTNEPQWKQSFQDYIICEANVSISKHLTSGSSVPACQLSSRPNLAAMVIHILAYFGAGIVMSSWVWNKASGQVWKRFFRRKLGLPNTDPVMLKKHQVIAQAFQKRQELNKGRLSLSFASTHDDPLGMRFDLASVTSAEMSSAWAAAIPRMVLRRGAVTQRRYSDSDVESIQSTCRQLGLEVRRVSLESPGSQDEDRQRHKKTRRKRGPKNRIAPAITNSSRGNEALDDRHRGSYTSSMNSKTPSITNVSAISKFSSYDSEDSNCTPPMTTQPARVIRSYNEKYPHNNSLSRPAKVRKSVETNEPSFSRPPPPKGAGYNIFTASSSRSNRSRRNREYGRGDENDIIELHDIESNSRSYPKGKNRRIKTHQESETDIDGRRIPTKAMIHRSPLENKKASHYRNSHREASNRVLTSSSDNTLPAVRTRPQKNRRRRAAKEPNVDIFCVEKRVEDRQQNQNNQSRPKRDIFCVVNERSTSNDVCDSSNTNDTGSRNDVVRKRKRRQIQEVVSSDSESAGCDRRTSTPKSIHTDIESFIEAKFEEDAKIQAGEKDQDSGVQVLHNNLEDDEVSEDLSDENEVFDSEDSNITPPEQRPANTLALEEDAINSDDSQMLTPPPHRPDRYGPLGSSQTTIDMAENLHTYSSPPKAVSSHRKHYDNGHGQIYGSDNGSMQDCRVIGYPSYSPSFSSNHNYYTQASPTLYRHHHSSPYAQHQSSPSLYGHQQASPLSFAHHTPPSPYTQHHNPLHTPPSPYAPHQTPPSPYTHHHNPHHTPPYAPQQSSPLSDSARQIAAAQEYSAKRAGNPVWSRFLLDNVSLASQPPSGGISPVSMDQEDYDDIDEDHAVINPGGGISDLYHD